MNSALLSLKHLNDLRPDLIIAHDPFTLPIALQLRDRCGAKVLLDAHEYTPRQYEDQWIHRHLFMKVWDHLCRKYLPHTDAAVTVCRSIADEYENNYGVDFDVITNAPFYSEIAPSVPDNNLIRIIYHGAVHASRKTDGMIRLMDLLDERFSLDLMLVKDNSHYFDEIYNLGIKHPRISFRDPVPMTEIIRTINKYDISLFLLSPETFSYRMALPNKIFEFIQARLAVAVWPSPEMAAIVSRYDCGVVSDEYTLESMAKKLNALTADDISRFKNNAGPAARELCAERNRDAFLDIVERLIGKD